jgi:arsenite transporter
MILMDGLTGGDNEYGAMLVAINSMLEMDLSAPIAILYLRVISGADKIVSYEPVAKSVVAFL